MYVTSKIRRKEICYLLAKRNEGAILFLAFGKVV